MSSARQRVHRHCLAERLGAAGKQLERAHVLRQPLDDVSGAEGVGALAVINVAVATIVQLGSFGLPSSNAYFISQDQAHFRSAAINSLIFALGVGTVLALGLSAVASLRPDWFGFVPPELIRIAAISIPFQLISLIGLNILLAFGKIREFNLLDLNPLRDILVDTCDFSTVRACE